MARFALAQKADRPALTALWQTCFGDEKAQIDAFWRALWQHIRVFAAFEGNAPVSMLCALPTSLVDEAGESCPAAYLYAVCTAPQRRRQGLCAALLAYAEKALQKEGCRFAALVPSNKELFGFYQKLGYQTAFFHREYTVSAGKRTAKITKLDADGYRNLREMQLYGAFLSYPLPLLQWQASASPGLYRIETAEAVCCCAAEQSGELLICKELLPDCPEAAASLAAKLGCKDALVRTCGEEAPFGMVKPLSDLPAPTEAYLGLAFD
ncbi:MAG: GNAT family N-acetyltransferase [Faecousia sp.]